MISTTAQAPTNRELYQTVAALVRRGDGRGLQFDRQAANPEIDGAQVRAARCNLNPLASRGNKTKTEPLEKVAINTEPVDNKQIVTDKERPESSDPTTFRRALKSPTKRTDEVQCSEYSRVERRVSSPSMDRTPITFIIEILLFHI